MISVYGFIKEVTMKVVIISKTSLDITELTSVSNIAFSTDNFTVTSSGNNYTYSYAAYNIQIIW